MYKKMFLFLSIATFLNSTNVSYCITNHDHYQFEHDDQKSGKKIAIALITAGILGVGSIAFIKYGYPLCKKLIISEPYDPWLGMSTSEIDERLREKQPSTKKVERQMQQSSIYMQQAQEQLEKGKAESKANLKKQYDAHTEIIHKYEQQLITETDPRKKSFIQSCIDIEQATRENEVGLAKAFGIDLFP